MWCLVWKQDAPLKYADYLSIQIRTVLNVGRGTETQTVGHRNINYKKSLKIPKG